MKICKSCKKEIDDKASKCPHCTSDQRIWFAKHPLLTVILILVVFSFIGQSNKGQSDKGPSLSSNNAQSSEQTSIPPSPKDSQDTLMKQNNPDVKHLTTLTADYKGKSFTLYVNAQTDSYYNYGFDDENKYYSLKLWDNSVSGSYSGVYGYISKDDPNSKALVEKILNGTTFLKIQVSIPLAKYKSGSNAFLQIDSWEEVQ